MEELHNLVEAIVKEVYGRDKKEKIDFSFRKIEEEILHYDNEGVVETLLLNRGTAKAYDLIADMNMLFIKSVETSEFGEIFIA